MPTATVPPPSRVDRARQVLGVLGTVFYTVLLVDLLILDGRIVSSLRTQARSVEARAQHANRAPVPSPAEVSALHAEAVAITREAAHHG